MRLWSKLRHENVLQLLGITTQFETTVSIVSPWMKYGATRSTNNESIDPRPLVS